MTQVTPDFSLADQPEAEFRDYITLLKPRVMRLVVFTAIAGMLAAPAATHPVIAVAALICIAVGAGASGALNMWWDADIDAMMERTSARPIPAGQVGGEEALGIGIGLSILSVGTLAVVANPLAAGLLAFTIFFYAVIYSMWLKRATPQNIVIGGAAGAFPPMIAWAAATGEIGVAPILMFLVIFLWTPPHFWALALFRTDDYTRVGVPMLPVVAGEPATRRQIWFYTLLMVPTPVALAFTDAGGPLLLIVGLVANVAFLKGAWAVSRRSAEDAAADRYRAEKKLFGVSIAYLFAIFGAVMADAVLHALVPGLPWPVLI
ncbi:MAG: heme o synthase [Pseudomonadota bacterium]